DPQDATARLIAERIAVNASEVGINLRPAPDTKSAAASIVRVRFRSPDTGEALAAFAPGAPAPRTPESLYAAERTLLEGYRWVPLFHLPDTYGVGPRVKNWSAARWGAWRLDGVWLAEKP